MSLQGARDDPGFLVGFGISAHSPILFSNSLSPIYLSAISGGFAQLGRVLTVCIVHCGFLSGAAEAVSVGQGLDTLQPLP